MKLVVNFIFFILIKEEIGIIKEYNLKAFVKYRIEIVVVWGV
jgi:hypothetical protein